MILLESSEDKLTHLEHPEDHYLNAGPAGFKHAMNTLVRTHNTILKSKKQVSHTVKKDGSPSVVFGYHPETGKFFVGTKSVFNKTPKVNYTYDDIERNHGHAPGLVDKLKAALDHIPKVTPKKGVYQGDIMFTHDDVHTDATHYRFTPNTITYGARKDSDLGKKIKKAKVGVYVHTHYHGDSFADLKAHYNKGNDGFGTHKDVVTDFGQAAHNYTPEQQKTFAGHIKEAAKHFKKLTDEDHGHIQKHSDHLKIYINKTVNTGTKPSAKGYADFLKDRSETVKDKGSRNKAASLIDHAKSIAPTLHTVLKMHHHVQAAKDQLVDALSHGHDLEHHIDSVPTKPEGHVVSIDNKPSKLNRRQEFNRLNANRNNR